MKAMRIALVLLLSCVLSLSAAAQRCGVERWSVKTGSDADAASVDLANPKTSDITTLIALAAPHPIPVGNRVTPTETTVFVIDATLTDYKLETGSSGDSDYHLVLKDKDGKTMVAEIPSPTCVDAGSPFAAQKSRQPVQNSTRSLRPTPHFKLQIYLCGSQASGSSTFSITNVEQRLT